MANPRAVLVVVVLGLIAAVYLIYSQWQRAQRAHSHEQFKKRWAEKQCSQEIVCDHCGESTIGLVLNRAQAGIYQTCPECGTEAGRPVVYYMCQNPGCNRRLVKVRNSVWTDEGPSAGDPVVCPSCGDVRGITPLFLDLKSAQKTAKETDQEFP